MRTVSINYECKELANLTSLRDTVLEMSKLANLPYIQKKCSSCVTEHRTNRLSTKVFLKIVVDKTETIGVCNIIENTYTPLPLSLSEGKDKHWLKKVREDVLLKMYSDNAGYEKELQRDSILTLGYRLAYSDWCWQSIWNGECTHFFCTEGPLFFTITNAQDEEVHKRL